MNYSLTITLTYPQYRIDTIRVHSDQVFKAVHSDVATVTKNATLTECQSNVRITLLICDLCCCFTIDIKYITVQLLCVQNSWVLLSLPKICHQILSSIRFDRISIQNVTYNIEYLFHMRLSIYELKYNKFHEYLLFECASCTSTSLFIQIFTKNETAIVVCYAYFQTFIRPVFMIIFKL